MTKSSIRIQQYLPALCRRPRSLGPFLSSTSRVVLVVVMDVMIVFWVDRRSSDIALVWVGFVFGKYLFRSLLQRVVAAPDVARTPLDDARVLAFLFMSAVAEDADVLMFIRGSVFI